MNVTAVFDARPDAAAEAAEESARVVFRGGLLIFPTDTVYGIGCDPYDPVAVQRLFGAKHRPGEKPLTLHVGSVREFLEYARDNPLAATVARHLLPGPVTLIVRRPPWVPPEVTSGLPTLGLRVPGDPLSQLILDRCGPLACTSANISGQQAYRGDGDWERLPPAELLIENGPTIFQRESSIIDVSSQHPRLLREGVLSFEELNERIGPMTRMSAPERNTGA